MDGIMNIMKPPGMTSHDVVAYLRKKLSQKKIGHTGTLDPGAAGVLPVCLGKATRVAEYVMEKRKIYRAELKLGVSTDTQDQFGMVVDTREVSVNEEAITDAVLSFIGSIRQIPPMYSAVKVEGKRLYDLARQGVEVERKARQVQIHDIRIIRITMPDTVLMDVTCSGGTYIRTLCADIGEKLGCGGHMSFLLRIASGSFDLSTALTLEEVEELGAAAAHKLMPIDRALDGYGACILPKDAEKRFLNGVGIEAGPGICFSSGVQPAEGLLYRVYNADKEFLGIAVIVRSDSLTVIKPEKIFYV